MPVIHLFFSMPLQRKLKKFLKEKLTKPGNIKRIMKEGAVMIKADCKRKKAGVKFDDIKSKLMEDAEFEKEYNNLKPRYDIISQIIEARKSMDMTQKELAERAGTKKSNISRLESGSYNPSLDFLIKIAKSLGKDISINIR